MLKTKNILIGITGGIAAYKICELIRRFKKSGANVDVVCTPNALNFVTKLTLQNLSQNEVYVEEFNVKDWKPEHISLADKADIMLIAPGTANTVSKIANGYADNLLTSIACAFSKKMIIAPAMNCNMWKNSAVQENLLKLKSRGVEILEPESGFLACGYMGKGRLCSLDKIFNVVNEALNSFEKLKGKKVVITSGGTIEDIDPVRYISNYSSGKMGFALANCANSMGADVVLITTKDFVSPYKIVKVKSALEMQNALDCEFEGADIVIMSAAVADYRVKEVSAQKMKKGDEDSITLELVKNPDILRGLCERRDSILQEDSNATTPIIVGFCAESENLLENAKSKIAKKGCDYLVANDISRKDIGFGADDNEVTILDKNGGMKKLQKASKTAIAREILEFCSK
ncbi:MAG: bifunctional phosphopantothenoylcysteine decarboxylase/phosphopantothenate--cysteine ligase CoaBC [Muribaculaceae bacterium]|nr:bifunctional phosphopantothenoylcysteine decarboxylase/phosphopantothenate--cysteine ligase CoaBC [Muribaculaceae bacterium]